MQSSVTVKLKYCGTEAYIWNIISLICTARTSGEGIFMSHPEKPQALVIPRHRNTFFIHLLGVTFWLIIYDSYLILFRLLSFFNKIYSLKIWKRLMMEMEDMDPIKGLRPGWFQWMKMKVIISASSYILQSTSLF